MMTIEDLEVVAGLLDIVIGYCDFEIDQDFIHVNNTYSKIRKLSKIHKLMCIRNCYSFSIKQKG